MRKFISVLVSFLVFVLGALIPLNVFATTEDSTTDITVADFSNASLETEDEYNFNEKIAKDDAFVNLVVQAAQKKEKNVSLEDVHPGRSIKLYGVEGSENVLQTFYDAYKEKKKIKNLISQDYSVLTLYFNKYNEYVDSLVFTRKENLPNAKDKDGWVMLSSGSMIIKDDFAIEYSEYNNLKKYVKNLGLKNAKELKFVSGIPNMPVSIYFVQNNVEFLIPLEDYANMTGSQVYKVSDVFDKYLKPVLDYQNEKSEEYSKLDYKNRPVGMSPFPDELPSITSIDLYTYFENDPIIGSKKENNFFTLSVVVASICILVIVCFCVVYIRKKKADDKS